VSAGNLATSGIARPRTAVDASEIEAVYVAFGLPWKAVGEAPGFRDAGGRGFGRASVLMPGPYDSLGKKANEVNTYDVFGRHN